MKHRDDYGGAGGKGGGNDTARETTIIRKGTEKTHSDTRTTNSGQKDQNMKV